MTNNESREAFEAWAQEQPMTHSERDFAWFAHQARDAEIDALKARIAELEKALVAAKNPKFVQPQSSHGYVTCCKHQPPTATE